MFALCLWRYLQLGCFTVQLQQLLHTNILYCSTHYVEIGLLHFVLVAALQVKRTLFYGFDDDERLVGVNRY